MIRCGAWEFHPIFRPRVGPFQCELEAGHKGFHIVHAPLSNKPLEEREAFCWGPTVRYELMDTSG